MEPIEFLDKARDLLKSSDESDSRTCISRAYYAAYHSCLKLASKIQRYQPTPKDAGSHEALIRELTNYPAAEYGSDIARKIKSVGHILAQLKKHRVQADYFLEAEIDKQLPQEAITMSERILEKVGELEALIEKD